jgi:probable O-glycosylation ligase (exosortase A-associated)
MREFLLLTVIVALAIAAIIRPKIGVFGLVWFALARPDVGAWSSGSYPFASILELGTLIGSVRILQQLTVVWRNAIFRLFLLLLVPLILSVALALHPTLCYQAFWWYITSVSAAALIPLVIQTEKDFRRLIVVMALSIGYVGSRYGLYGVIHGGARFSGGYGGSYSDNNTLGLALAMGIPICWYGRNLVRWLPVRLGLLLATFLTIGGVVFTHSRGAAISVLAAFVVILLHGRHRLLMLVALVVLTAPSVYLVRDSYFDRMGTLKNTQTAEKDESIQDRMEAARVGWRIWQDYPLIGVGFGSFNEMSLWHRYAGPDGKHNNAFVMHDTYLQMLVDSGIFALLAYLAMLGTAVVLLDRSVRRLKRAGSPFYQCPLVVEVGLVAFAVGSTFLTRITFDLLYILVMTAVAWLIVEPEHLESWREEQESVAAEEDAQLQEAEA